MIRAAAPVAVALLIALAGCGGGPSRNAAALKTAELAVRALDRAVGVQTAFVGTSNINTGATPDIIAAALDNRVRSEASGCVQSSHSGPTVHADFGSGCALATALMRAGGTVDAMVQPDPNGGIDVVLTLAATVDGAPLTGSFTTATPDGNVFSYAADVTLGGVAATAAALRSGIAAGGATLDATNATANGTALILSALHERFAACYPDDGAVKLGTLGITFASDTPQTGTVTLSTGASDQLPTRSGCPH